MSVGNAGSGDWYRRDRPHLEEGLANQAIVYIALRRPAPNGDPGAADAFLAVREADEALMARHQSVGVYLGIDTLVGSGVSGDPAVEERPTRGGGRSNQGGRGGSGPVKVWQRTGVELRRPLAERVRVAITGLLGRRVADWAIETHWEGIRDLRWGACVRWDEILGVRGGTGWSTSC